MRGANLQELEMEIEQTLKRYVRTYSKHVWILTYRSITCYTRSSSFTEEMRKMKLITLYLPETYIKALDQLVDERFYPNRAEAIRVAIRDMISEEVWRRNGSD